MSPEIVKKPMDLSTVMGGLDKGNYKTLGRVKEGHIDEAAAAQDVRHRPR